MLSSNETHFAAASAAAAAANVADGAVPGLPRFAIGMHLLHCDASGKIDASLGRSATLARTSYSRVREVGLLLHRPPQHCVLVPATSQPQCETPYRVTIYCTASDVAQQVRLEHVDSNAVPRRSINGAWRVGSTAGGSFSHGKILTFF